jgi:hypothetical protein
VSSGIKSAQRDVSCNFRPAGVGAADMRKLWNCGHKSHRGKKRGGLLWMCARCVEAKGGKA